MKPTVLPFGLLLGLLTGCEAPPRTPGPPPAPVGVTASAVDRSVVGEGNAPPALERLPDRLALPAAYRAVLVDGRLELVRETDAEALKPLPASLRVVVGEVARGELAFQPGLLPQELAREVAANRESSARMDNALDAVLQRSRELARQALQLQDESRALADRLVAAETRVRELEAAKPAPTPRPVPASPDPNN
jgi:hypothetical protein